MKRGKVEERAYCRYLKMAGGICASLELVVYFPCSVYSGQDFFTIHQFMLKIVNAKAPGEPFSSASTVGRHALWRNSD